MDNAAIMKTHSYTKTESTLLDFLDTAAALERKLDRSLALRGISFSEFKLIRALIEGGESGRSRVELAECVGLTPSAVTRALKPLEKLGIVVTTKSARDARQSLATITRAGRELYVDAFGLLRDALADLPMSAATTKQVDEFAHRLADLRATRSR